MKKDKNGYALLFSILIISAISVVTAGLVNTIYKQLVLSLLSKDSSTAFYQADSAIDCAMYADFYLLPQKYFLNEPEITCGGVRLIVEKGDYDSYKLLPANETSESPCFRINVNKKESKTTPGEFVTVEMSARGYNICDVSNPRAVEREVLVKFK